MNNSLYIAATSLMQNQKKMDVVSNNLANINTTGYKKDLVISESFPEVLLSKINDTIDYDNHRPFEGVKVETDGEIYKLSINSGYFKVKTPAGIGYTRELQFTIDENGYLRTSHRNSNGNIETVGENYVLGKNGPIIVEGNDIQIDDKGNVISNGQTLDNLIVFPPPNVIGTTSAGVRLDRIATNFTQGNLIETGNSLDFALKGEGFFKIHTNQGIMYTRDGSFTLNDNGELITTEGHFVLGQYGSIIADGNDFTINENGEIIRDGEVVDRLDIVQVINNEHLRKQGNNLYAIEEGIEPEEILFEGQVLQGYLENSNVDTIKEMVNMISLLRSYEASQKIIKSQDELLEKAANEIGRA